ncbi:MAG: hypothetical protein JWO71_654 [Candidatus Acidoferrum typicum]|nr:hypothetical protein [Candidatus Acidoferrum typicum]
MSVDRNRGGEILPLPRVSRRFGHWRRIYKGGRFSRSTGGLHILFCANDMTSHSVHREFVGSQSGAWREIAALHLDRSRRLLLSESTVDGTHENEDSYSCFHR